jgi:SAM-dependent methyltransferase
VLDYGCGDAALVSAYADAGFDAWGCDVVPTRHPNFRLIETQQLPFADASFDLIVSETVLEHVPGTQEVEMAEWRRVLKPGGAALHLFPPRTIPIEPHTGVPLASVVRSTNWLLLWARLGVRAHHQRGTSARIAAEQNHNYLTARTNYLPLRHYKQLAGLHFARIRFVEREWLDVSARRPLIRAVAGLGQHFPLIPWMYGHFYYRVMLLETS